MSILDGLSADQLRAAIEKYNGQQQPQRCVPTTKDDARTAFLLTLPSNQLTKDDRNHLSQSVQDALAAWKAGTLE